MVIFQKNGLDGISSLGSCPPSDARFSGSLLQTINWVKKGNQMVPKICVVFWSYESFVFANPETEICRESCSVHFPTKPTMFVP